jgi:hypothetical protein
MGLTEPIECESQLLALLLKPAFPTSRVHIVLAGEICYNYLT